VLPEARLSSLDTRAACEETRPKIGAVLSEIWNDKIRYREAHEVTLADDCVVLDGVARSARANSGSSVRSWLS